MDKKINLIEHFSIITDPRMNRKKQHKLIDIIVVSVCAMISGCDSFVEIENYGNSKLEWLKEFLELPHGIPSHDTFGRVFSLINSLEIQKAFYSWTQSLVSLDGEIINIDGKYLNASYGATSKKNRSIFGMVNAWASEAGVALAQLRTDYEKKDEKQAFREIIDFLELKGATVTMDANGCHANIVNKVIEKEGDYFVALKNNQKSLCTQVKSLIEDQNVIKTSFVSKLEKDHGRIERRSCIAFNLSDAFRNSLRKKTHQKNQVMWMELNSACRVSSERTVKGITKIEHRYYISSISADAEKMNTLARAHWGVENNLHWVLDVAFDEDRCRVRNGYAGENLAVIRQLSLNLLKQETSIKRSIKGKRLKCGWENEYLKKVILGAKEENIF